MKEKVHFTGNTENVMKLRIVTNVDIERQKYLGMTL